MVRSPAASGPHSPGDLVDSYRRLADEAAPGGLLSAGAFAHFPGAVLLAGHNGIVLNANELAEPIGQLLQSGQHEELRTRSEEHTSELQSLMRISYAVFCLKKKKKQATKQICK